MCDMSVNADFHADFMLNYQQKLVPLLHDGIRVMIYVGMEVRRINVCVFGWLIDT